MSDPTPPANDDDERASQVLLAELGKRRDQLAGEAQLPGEDKALSERIFAEARRRSAQLSGAASSTAVTGNANEGIPWWLWLAWAVAIAATAAAFIYLV